MQLSSKDLNYWGHVHLTNFGKLLLKFQWVSFITDNKEMSQDNLEIHAVNMIYKYDLHRFH
jgi:hypothetical protein